MQGDLQGGTAERDKLGRYKPGYSSRRVKLERIAAKLAELTAEYFPNGGYVTAETCRDPVVAQRATRCAEYLLSKLKPPSAPRSPAVDQAALALELLLKQPLDGV